MHWVQDKKLYRELNNVHIADLHGDISDFDDVNRTKYIKERYQCCSLHVNIILTPTKKRKGQQPFTIY